jgi:hypothetical protein
MKFEEQAMFQDEIQKYVRAKDMPYDLHYDLEDLAFGSVRCVAEFLRLRSDSFHDWLEEKGKPESQAENWELQFLEHFRQDFADFALTYFKKHGVN